MQIVHEASATVSALITCTYRREREREEDGNVALGINYRIQFIWA